jgi:hypothetical protein
VDQCARRPFPGATLEKSGAYGANFDLKIESMGRCQAEMVVQTLSKFKNFELKLIMEGGGYFSNLSPWV